MRVLALYAFGPKEQLLQAYFALLTLHPYLQQGNIRALVVTDQPEYFSELSVLQHFHLDFYHLTPELLTQWKGEPACNFRVKLKTIEYVTEHYPSASSFLVCDGDIFALQSPMPLFEFIEQQEGLVFSEPEGRLGDRRPKSAAKHWSSLSSQGMAGSGFTKGMPLYNAGIIGMKGSDQTLIRETIAFFDPFFAQTKFYFAEQLSLVRQAYLSKRPVKTSMEYLRHYWYDKSFRDWMAPVVEDFKNHPKAKGLAAQELPLTKVLPFHEFFSLRQKWKRKLQRLFSKK